MASSNSPCVIQQKFIRLFEDTSAFFESDRLLQDKDIHWLGAMRFGALNLKREAASPDYDRFLAYLLGCTSIGGDYPLQSVRLACLVAKALYGEDVPSERRQEIVTAALLCDTGFRPAWLGGQGSHFENTVFQLKTMGFPWVTPSLERLILKHHQAKEDPSPHHILYLMAQYLSLVYGTGTDDIGHTLISPAKAIESLMLEHEANRPGLKLVLKALSAFPLGSWVQLNSGEAALVIGTNVKSPLRPKVGLYKSAAKSNGRWEELNLEMHPAQHISSELRPSTVQTTLLNFPEILVSGWTLLGETLERDVPLPSAADVNTIERDGETIDPMPAHVKTAEDFHNHLFKQHKADASKEQAKTEADPGAPPISPEEVIHSGMSTTKHPLLAFYRSELAKLRSTWEQQVRAAEQVTANLKSPLLESYRRENDLMAGMIERLESMATQPAAPAAEPPPPPPPVETELTLEHDFSPDTSAPVRERPIELSNDPQAGLDQIQTHLDSFQSQADRDHSDLLRLRKKFQEALQRLENRDDAALPFLISFLRPWQQHLKPIQETLEKAEGETEELTTEWKKLKEMTRELVNGPQQSLTLTWQTEIKPRMLAVLRAGQQALGRHHQRLLMHEKIIDRFCAEAGAMAGKKL